MKKIKKYILFVSGGVLLASLIYLAGSSIPSTLGSAPMGLPAGSSTVSFISASSTAGFFINPNNSCSSRIISTASTSIMLSFGSTTPTADRGHWQAASSTIAYDSGLYGCGMWSVWSDRAGTISITEFQ